MIRIVLSFLLLLSIPLLSAEEDHGSETEKGTAKTGKRLEAEGKLSNDAVKFLSTHFFRTEDIIRKDFDTKIPTAIEKAIQNKEEGEISEILAGLVATVPPQQAEAIIKDAKKEIKEESEGKDAGKFDTRYVALMERILWAAMNRNGELPDSEKAKEFNSAFKDPYTKARDFSKIANSKSKLAAEGNKEAKQWVDANIRKDTVLSIAEGMRKAGAKDQGNTLIRGQSMDLGNGQRALDMWGPGKEPQRLYLGDSTKTASQAIDKFLGEKKTFGNNVASRRELPNNKSLKSWFVDGSGTFKKGSPKGFEPKEDVAIPIASGGGVGGQVTLADTNISQLENALKTGKCTSCHTLTLQGTSLLDAVLVHPSKSVRLADFPAHFNNPADPMAAEMRTNSARQMFEEFARIQRGATK